MQEWYKYPSLWRFLPSAILHFLFVEVRAALAAVASWFMLCLNIKYLTDVGENAEHLSARERKELGEMKDLAMWIVFALVFVPAVLLIVYGLFGFVFQAGAPMSCGSGAYLGWTWKLERDKVYKALVMAMSFTPLVTFCTVGYDIVELWLQVERHREHKEWRTDANTLEQLVLNIAVPSGVMLAALIGLACPQFPPNGWDQEQLSSILLARSWPQCFQANDLFGLKLVDALWKAEHGKPDELQNFLACPEEETIVRHVCREPEESAEEEGKLAEKLV